MKPLAVITVPDLLPDQKAYLKRLCDWERSVKPTDVIIRLKPKRKRLQPEEE